VLLVDVLRAVKPILATNNLLFFMAELIVEKIVAPRSKIVELSVVIVDPLTANTWLAVDKFLDDKPLVDGPTSVAVSPSAAEPILVVDSFAVGDLDLTIERMTLFVGNHREHTAILGQHLVRMSILEFD
jgi:hypothetical protein